MKLKIIVIYFFGVIMWMIIFSTLRINCVTNVLWHIDGLWNKRITKNFVDNITGEIAFNASVSEYACQHEYIYTANYYPNGLGSEFQKKTLTELVDTKTWNKISADTTTTTYIDSRFKYVIYNNSDGLSIGVFDK